MIAIAATVVVGFALMAWTQRGMATAPPDNAAGGTELTIDNFVFGPSTLPVASDTTVTWTATMYLIPSSATTKLPSNQRLSIERFSYTFTKPGKCFYFCSVHPKMTEEVIVQ